MQAMTLARLLSIGGESRPDRILAELQLSAADWEEILRQSIRHGVAPLLHYRLKRAGASAQLPATVWEKLQILYLSSAATNASLYRDLVDALKFLLANGIEAIILKGGYLAQHVYDNIALRPMSDFDLLIKEADLPRANTLFFELGYRASGNSEAAMPIAKYHHLPPLLKKGEVPVGIELHWTLEKPSAGFNIDVAGLWRRARPAAFGNTNALALCMEDLLLHLCLHASYHHQFRFGLRPFCDVAVMLRRCHNQLDWEQLQTRANAWGVTKCVYVTLRLAAELLEANVPETVLQVLKPRELKQSFVAVSKEFTLQNIGDSFLWRKILALWNAEGWPDKLTILKNGALPEKNTMVRLYSAAPNSKLKLSYLKRWKELLCRYAPFVWQMLRRRKQLQVLLEEERNRQALKQWLTEA